MLAADVPPREAEMLYQQMDKIATLRARDQGKKFVSNAFAAAISWGDKKMKNEYFVYMMVCADIRNRILRVRKEVLSKVHVLGSPESEMYFTYKNRYPDFDVMPV